MTKEIDGYVWFHVPRSPGSSQEQFFSPEDYTELVRGVAISDKAEAIAPTTGDDRRSTSARSGAPRAAVISLGDTTNNTVGIYITASKLRELIPVLEDEGVTIVVFRIMSGGGYLLELERLSDVIHEEYKPEVPDCRVDRVGNLGCRNDVPLHRRDLFHVGGQLRGLHRLVGQPRGDEGTAGSRTCSTLMERISARGGYDHRIMRSMQIMEPLSATYNEDGDIEFFQDRLGRYQTQLGRPHPDAHRRRRGGDRVLAWHGR